MNEVLNGILKDVKNRSNWTPEFFDRVRTAPYIPEYYGGYNQGDGRNYIGAVHSKIRRVLSAQEYEDFDEVYCDYVRPGQEGITEYIKQMNKERVAKH